MKCGVCGQALTAEHSFGVRVTVIHRDDPHTQVIHREDEDFICSQMCAHSVVARAFRTPTAEQKQVRECPR